MRSRFQSPMMRVFGLMRHGRAMVPLLQSLSKLALVPMVLAGVSSVAQAQSLDDAIFMDRRILCAGLIYTQDQWSEYWEGSLKRDNGNIGTLTTRQTTYMAAYGVTNRLNIIASLPYVWTKASQGVLEGQSGSQDISVGLKYRVFSTPLTTKGTLSGIAVISATVPTSNYTPDFYPMSIGSSSKRATARAILTWQATNGIYVNGAAAYTRRGNVTLDRVSYYTQDQLFLTNEVQMPDVQETAVTLGYRGHGLIAPVTLTRQKTLGGGDIRRQDMPFVSNRMDFTSIGGHVQYQLPMLKVVSLQVGASHVLTGRNVGQSTAVMGGLLLAGKL